jgi:MFS family permease
MNTFTLFGIVFLLTPLSSVQMAVPKCSGDVCADRDCRARDLAFDLTFTVASTSTQGSRFFLGMLLDRFGARTTATGCAAMVAFGVLLMAVAPSGGGGAFVLPLGFVLVRCV